MTTTTMAKATSKVGPRLAARAAIATIAASATSGLFLVAGDAAASPTSKLVYARGHGAEACPDESAFRATVATRTGYDPFFPFAKRTVVTRLDVVERQYRARMEILDAHGSLVGEKTFAATDGDCDELVRTLALAVSLAIDVADEPEPEAQAPEHAAIDEPTPAPAPPDSSKAKASFFGNPSREGDRANVDGEAPKRLGLSVDTRGSLGLGPAASLGVGVGLDLRGNGWSVGLEGRRDAGLPGSVGSSGDVSISVWAGTATACAYYGKLFGCAVATVGQANATSHGIARPASDNALFLAAGARVGAELPIDASWSLRGFFELAGVPLRHDVRIGREDVYETNLVVASLGIGAAFHF